MNIKECIPSNVCYAQSNLIMTHRLVSRVLLLLLSCNVSLQFAFARTADTDKSLGTNSSFQVSPGPMDGRIAFVTARLLEETHFSKQHLDAGVSAKFFERYLESLDPQRIHFTQQDLAQFESFRTNLGDLTVTRRGVADVKPGCEIFNRFMERLQERVAYVDEVLKKEKFTFDADERFTINRREQPFPKDLNEAKKLWRDRVRFEYLQEKLSKTEAKKKAVAAPDKAATPKKDKDARPKSESEEIVDTLTHTYHRSLRNFMNWSNDDVLQVYLDALARTYDPHSDYMGSANLDSFAIAMNLSLSGIGAELMSEDGYCTIMKLLDG